MLCLGIETSCDDTGVALVENGRVRDSLLASQANAHAIFGGVVPELASREHSRCLALMFDALLKRNMIEAKSIDVIAVTRGPGLLGSLLAGIAFAKGLALAFEKPLLGINHLHAHLLGAGIDRKLIFPALGLVISGGHTEIYRMESPERFIRLGRTLDDAAGEAFDKVGKFIGMPYPAGKEMDELAQRGDPFAFQFPLAYTRNENLDFSFSGLKTAAINLAKIMDKGADTLANFCAALNKAVADSLSIKIERALKTQQDINALYIAGGVAANSHIRRRFEQLSQRENLELLIPALPLCMDNAAMVAYTGHILAEAGFYHGLELEAVPRGRKIPDDLCHE